MLVAVLIALAICLPLNYFFFGGSGALEWLMAIIMVPKALEAIIAFGIETEAELSGFRSAGHHWKKQWKQLLLLLTVALFLRGTAIYLVGMYFGLPHAMILAAGLIATDPAAMGIALGLVNIRRLEELAWLLTVESLLNDVIALIAFEAASGMPALEILINVILTVVAAGLLSLADAGVRWLVRLRFFHGSEHEALAETIAVAIVYLAFIFIGIRAELSLIGMVAMGAIMTNFVEDLLPHERRHVMLEKRLHLQEWWSRIGLGVVLGVVALIMPIKEILADPSAMLIGLVIDSAIFASRFVYDMSAAFFLNGPPKKRFNFAMVSILAANTLLGVPTVIGAVMWHLGFMFESRVIFAAIAESLPIILPTVLYIWLVEKHPAIPKWLGAQLRIAAACLARVPGKWGRRK